MTNRPATARAAEAGGWPAPNPPSQRPERPQDLRLRHAALVLRTIQLHGPISRAQLVRLTHLSQPTISAIVDGLLAKDLLVWQGEGQSTGGRRPALLALKPDSAYVVAVDLGGTTMTMGLIDMGGRVVRREQVPSPGVGGDGAPEAQELDTTRAGLQARTFERVCQRLQWFLDSVQPERPRLLAMGLGLPGVVDPTRGVVTMAPALGWSGLSVVESLEQRFGLPVFIENDVNAAALAEHKFGAGQHLRDFAFVAIGTGIGAGLILDGRLYRGHADAAGEVGYLAIDREWVRQAIATGAATGEAFGCWESLAAAPAIVLMAREEMECQGQTPPADLTAQRVMELAAQGDPIGLRVLERLAENLALGLANIVVLLDPEAVVLGGGVAKAGDLLLSAIRERLAKVSPLIPKLLLSSLGEDAGLLGAAAVALDGVLPRILSRT